MNTRILAISLSARGLGFAVMEGEQLVDWGTRSMRKGNKNRQMVEKTEKLIASYQPTVIALEDLEVKSSRRVARTRKLNKMLLALANENHLDVKLFSKEQVRKTFSQDEKSTKHDRSQLIAARFTDLAHKLPPERKPWESEGSSIGIFDATALALTFQSSAQI